MFIGLLIYNYYLKKLQPFLQNKEEKSISVVDIIKASKVSEEYKYILKNYYSMMKEYLESIKQPLFESLILVYNYYKTIKELKSKEKLSVKDELKVIELNNKITLLSTIFSTYFGVSLRELIQNIKVLNKLFDLVEQYTKNMLQILEKDEFDILEAIKHMNKYYEYINNMYENEEYKRACEIFFRNIIARGLIIGKENIIKALKDWKNK